MTAHEGLTSQPSHQVPEGKQTSLGLYVTAKEAYEMWTTEPERVNILDIRTPEEYVFVGHPEMARNTPIVFVKHQWDADTNEFVMEPNHDFISHVKGLFALTDTLWSCVGLGAVAPGRSKRLPTSVL
jgi:hypothetical protein